MDGFVYVLTGKRPPTPFYVQSQSLAFGVSPSRLTISGPSQLSSDVDERPVCTDPLFGGLGLCPCILDFSDFADLPEDLPSDLPNDFPPNDLPPRDEPFELALELEPLLVPPPPILSAEAVAIEPARNVAARSGTPTRLNITLLH